MDRIATWATAFAMFDASALSAETIRAPQPSLIVTPAERVTFSGPEGDPFYPSFVQYQVSATTGTIRYTINVPAWLSVGLNSGTAEATGRTVTVLVNRDAAQRLRPGNYTAGVAFTNVTNGKGSTVRPATLIVSSRPPGK